MAAIPAPRWLVALGVLALLLTALTPSLPPAHVEAAPVPATIPSVYQPVYTALSSSLGTFESLLLTQTAPQANTPTYGTSLSLANGQRGTALLAPYAINGVQLQLDRLHALGVKGVTLEVTYPEMLPSYSDSPQYSAFFRSVVQEVRNRGMALYIETGVALPNTGGAFPTNFTLPASLCVFETQQQQMVQAILTQLAPDYLTLANEPSSMYQVLPYPQFDPSQGTQGMLHYVTYLLGNAPDPSCPANTPTPLVRGATHIVVGQGNWDSPQYALGYAQLPNLDAIDIHVYPIMDTPTHPFLRNLFTIAGYAKQYHKRLTISEAWDNKEQESELTAAFVGSIGNVLKRDAFSFWSPTDQRFINDLVLFSKTNPVDYVSPFWSGYFEAYLDYTPGVYDENTSYAAMQAAVTPAQVDNMKAGGAYTMTGSDYQWAMTNPAPTATSMPSQTPLASPTATRPAATPTATRQAATATAVLPTATVTRPAATSTAVAIATTPTATISFTDNFQTDALGSPPTGWIAGAGSWNVVWDLRNNSRSIQATAPTTAWSSIVAGQPVWRDYVISAQMTASSRTANVAILARVQNATTYYALCLSGTAWSLRRVVGGVQTSLASGSLGVSYNPTAWHTLALTVKGTAISGAIDGVLVGTVTDTAIGSGVFALGGNGQVWVDNVVVQSA